jgi:hypothetical protein
MGGIWDSSGNLITSFNLPQNFNSGQYNWKGVNYDTPIILEANKIYYLGAANPSSGWNANTYLSVPPSVHPDITFIGTVRSQTLYQFAFPGAINPTDSGSAGNAMVGPDISFNVITTVSRANINIGGNTGILSYINSASNGVVSAGPVTLNGNDTIVYTNANATITSIGTVSVAGTNNQISLPGGYLNGTTNILLSGTNLSFAPGATLSVTGFASGNAALSVGQSYTNPVSIYSLQTNATSVYLTVTQNTDPLSQGLVAYYPFNGTFNDLTGNLGPAANSGAFFAADRFGNTNGAIGFSGSQYAIISGLGSVMSGSPSGVTVSGWYYCNPGSTNFASGFIQNPSGQPGPSIRFDVGLFYNFI